jgi:hypothetical protein
MPGEDPETLPPPEAIAPAILRMTSADFAETGRIYDVRQDRLMSLRAPE